LLQGACFHFRSGKVQANQHCTVQLVTTCDSNQIKQHVHVYILKQLAYQINSHDAEMFSLPTNLNDVCLKAVTARTVDAMHW